MLINQLPGQSLDVYLKDASDAQRRQCNECKEVVVSTNRLLRCPKVVTVGVKYNTGEMAKDELQCVLSAISQHMDLGQVLDVDPSRNMSMS